MSNIARRVCAAPTGVTGSGSNRRFVFNFDNPEEAIALMDSLGASYSVDADGYYFDEDTLTWLPATVNRPRVSYNPAVGLNGLLGEPTVTNNILYSAEDNAAWSRTNCGIETATSIISGKTAPKLTPTSTAGQHKQTFGTFTGSDETIKIDIETNASEIQIHMRGAVNHAWMKYTTATGATENVVSQGGDTIQSHYGYALGFTGPNGGAMHRVIMHYDSTRSVGAARELRFYPSSGSAGSGEYSILHHAEQSDTVYACQSPVVTEGSAVTRTFDQVSIADLLSDDEAAAVEQITLGCHSFREYGVHPANSLAHNGLYLNQNNFTSSVMTLSNGSTAGLLSFDGGVQETSAKVVARASGTEESIFGVMHSNRLIQCAIDGDVSTQSFTGASPPANAVPPCTDVYFASLESGAQQTHNQVFSAYIEYGARSLSEIAAMSGDAVQ